MLRTVGLVRRCVEWSPAPWPSVVRLTITDAHEMAEFFEMLVVAQANGVLGSEQRVLELLYLEVVGLGFLVAGVVVTSILFKMVE